MDYEQHPVPAALKPHVAGVWRLRDVAQAGVQTIYPDGYCELIVHFSAPPECQDEHGWHAQAATLFASQRLGAVRLRREAPLDCFGVQLTTEASGLLGAGVLQRTRERIADLAAIDATLSASLTAAAHAFVAGAAQPLWALLARLCAAHTLDPEVTQAVAAIRAAGGQARVDTVARALGVPLRTLQQRFRRATGLTIKEFSRLMRLQATLRDLDAGNGSLSELALDRGFADQAHATRELKRTTGLCPTALRAALRADRGADAAIRLAAAFVRGRR